MNPKVLLIAGIIILLLSLLADVVGIGREPGFGMGQTAGTVIGVILIIVGVLRLRKK